MYAYNMPITANFIVTRNCNCNCIFCGVEHKSLKKDLESDYNKIKHIIDRLDESGIFRINFFGGEPLVYPHIIKAVKYAKSKNFYTSMVSNGLALSESMCEDFKNTLDVIGISIHGLEDTHNSLTRIPNSFKNAIKSLKLLNKYNIPVCINMTVTKNNYTEIPQLVSLIVKEAHVTGFCFNRCIPNKCIPDSTNEVLSPTTKELTESLYLIKDLDEKYTDIFFKYSIHFPYCLIKDKSLIKYIGSCGFGQNYISIDEKGNIQLCSYTNEILGNIFEQNLKDLWNNHKELKNYRNENWLPLKCKSCIYKIKCMSGCKASSGKGYFAPDILLKEVCNNE